MKIKKQCSCGVWHFSVPAEAKFQRTIESNDPLDGWYWNCGCGSTLFLAFDEALKAIAA